VTDCRVCVDVPWQLTKRLEELDEYAARQQRNQGEHAMQ